MSVGPVSYIGSGDPPPDDELMFPVALPDGSTAMCPVDNLGRIDPRHAYGPWLKPRVRARREN